MGQPLDLTLVRRFANTLNGDSEAAQFPGGPAGQVVVYRQGVVQSLDTTNFVALCMIGGGTSKVPVMVLDGNYPIVGQTVVIGVFGQSYYLAGAINTPVPIGGLVANKPWTSYSAAASGTVLTLVVPVIHGQSYEVKPWGLTTPSAASWNIQAVSASDGWPANVFRYVDGTTSSGAVNISGGGSRLYVPASTGNITFTCTFSVNTGTTTGGAELTITRVV